MSTVGSLVLGHVIEEVLDPFTPATPLRITYNNRLLLAGVELKPSAVANKPRVDVGGNDLRVFYTLVLVDPDAPSPSNPSLREYLHWPGTCGLRKTRTKNRHPSHGICAFPTTWQGDSFCTRSATQL
ncbi:hypothetical protein BRADI_2g49795v3 [Brachypodium distachyon]|uniref:Uncharacterized protein n=1 Tax=Brachypodium distachyon TaxID=15368 RepID=A0A2K2DF23_BRADI|nr:hypothetical protein BRADI_2g49795v3 [Brachypodium distachyon]